MVLAQTGGATTFSLAVVLAVIYLLVVRAMDVNEKEPFWSTALAFGIGFLTGAMLYLLVPTTVLEVDLDFGTMIAEIAVVVAVAVAITALMRIGQLRGLAVVDGTLDGVVYGSAVGFGFATGAVFVTDLLVGEGVAAVIGGGGALSRLWPLALQGLAQGVFAAITGAALAAAATTRDRGRRMGLVLGGTSLAVVAHVLYAILQRDGALTAGGQIRALLALAIPVLFLVGVIVVSLRAERRAITTAFPEGDELVDHEDRRRLKSYTARRTADLRRLRSGDIDGWAAQKALHTRLVQLAFARQRVQSASSDAERHAAEAHAERLRQAVLASKAALGAPAQPASTEQVGA